MLLADVISQASGVTIALAVFVGTGAVTVAVWASTVRSSVEHMKSDVRKHEEQIRALERWQDQRDGYAEGRKRKGSGASV